MNGQDSRLNLLGHGSVHDELGQIATIVGSGHFDHRKVGARIDAVRERIEDIAAAERGAVVVTDAGIVRAERWMLNEMHDGLTNRECIDAILNALRGQ